MMVHDDNKGAGRTSFPPGVASRLGYYVYRLVDPRSGNTFYVGKGTGDRVFAHAAAMVRPGDFGDEGPDPKLGMIRAILDLGLSPSHVIHRHGLDEQTALEVEAALIDAYPGLTNVQGGRGSSERGAMHAEEIVNTYERPIADFGGRRLLVIKIKQSLDEGKSIYDATRFAWKLKPERAREAEWVLAASRGVILEVFQVDTWLPASDPEFKGLIDTDDDHGRFGFVGNPAPNEIRSRWVNHRLPDEYTKPGAASPIRYVNFSPPSD